MFIFHFFRLKNADCETGKIVYKDEGRPENLARHPSPGAFAEWADWRGGKQGEMPDWAKKDRTSAALDTLGTQVDATAKAREELENAPHPVTPGAKEHLRARTESDIFGNKETQDWYLKAVREALEGVNGDDLYEFIRAHNSYEKKSNHVQWNRDFAKLLNLAVDEKYQGGSEDVTNRRITAATQHLLVEFYKNDVFQLTQKMPNPWIFIDGRMGPYSVSVLSEYWMAKYGKESKKSPKPPGDARVAGDYKPGSPEAKLYDAAIRYRDGQIKKPESSAEAGASEEADVDGKVKARYARLDRAGDSLTASDLKIDGYACDTDMKLSAALGLAYDEEPMPADRDTRKSPRLFRVLSLLAQQVGAEVDSMDIISGDVLQITADGHFSVTKTDGTVRYAPIKIFQT